MNDYRHVIDMFAYGQLPTVPDKPDEALAIGNDEVMNSLEVFVPTKYVPVQQRLFIPTGTDVSFEDMALDGTGAGVEGADFLTSGAFFGDWTNRGY